MSRLPLPDPDRVDGARRAQYDRFPSKLTRALLLLDDRLRTVLPAAANALRDSELDAATREAIILRVASLAASPYERFQHVGQAKRHGWTDADIAAIESGDYHSLNPGTAAVLLFADGCYTGTLDDITFLNGRNCLGDRGVMTVIVLVGHYMTVARITGILQLELDAEPDPWNKPH